MAADRECPKCGQPMVHQEAEPDVGIHGAWVCDCGAVVDDDDAYGDDYDMDRP